MARAVARARCGVGGVRGVGWGRRAGGGVGVREGGLSPWSLAASMQVGGQSRRAVGWVGARALLRRGCAPLGGWGAVHRGPALRTGRQVGAAPKTGG